MKILILINLVTYLLINKYLSNVSIIDESNIFFIFLY